MGTERKRTNLAGLETLALAQGGYFHRTDAHTHGLSDALLHHHTQTGRFARVLRGVYRLRSAPIARHDGLLLAWVWSGYRGVISHESALALYELSDVLPSRMQLTVPPTVWRPAAPFELHRAALRPDEVILFEGMPVTTPARSIVDAAAMGAGPEQIEQAVEQAIRRAFASPAQLRAAASRKGYRHRRTVEPLIERAITYATA